MQNTILTLIGGGIGGFFARYLDFIFDNQKEKNKQQREMKKIALYKLYLPIVKRINSIRIINGECRNLNVSDLRSIIDYIENNYEYASKDLIQNYWKIIDELEVVQSGEEIIDVGYLVDCVDKEYNQLKKEVMGF